MPLNVASGDARRRLGLLEVVHAHAVEAVIVRQAVAQRVVRQRTGVDAAGVGRAASELADDRGAASIDRDVDVYQRDGAGGRAAVPVGIGAGPVEREDAVGVRRRRQSAELGRRERGPGVGRVARQDVGHGRVEVRDAGAGLDGDAALALGVAGGVVGDAVEGVEVAVLPVEGEGDRAGSGRGEALSLVEAEGPVVDRDIEVDRGDARGRCAGGSGGVVEGDRDREAIGGLGRAERVDDVAGRRRGVHQPGGGERARAGDAVGVVDVGGVDGERVVALGRGQSRQAADGVGRRPRPGRARHRC